MGEKRLTASGWPQFAADESLVFGHGFVERVADGPVPNRTAEASGSVAGDRGSAAVRRAVVRKT